MALGPVVLSVLYEANGESFHYPLLLLASANMVGASVMACVPYNSRGGAEITVQRKKEELDDEEQLGLLNNAD